MKKQIKLIAFFLGSLMILVIGACNTDGVEKLPSLFKSKMSDKPVVAILVNQSIAKAIHDELSVFISDLRNDGFRGKIHIVKESTPPELRSYLQKRYQHPGHLVGAILIGSVPTPRHYIYYPASDTHPQRGPYTGASYQYYEDLDGDFQLQDASQWLYDGHSGDVETEIWISVLPPLATDADTISAIQRYFLKNHLYRIGLDRPAAGYLHPIIGSQFDTEELYNHQVNYILGLEPGSYQYSWGPLTSRGNVLVAPNNLLNDPVNFPGSDEVFYQEIQTGDYDVLISSAHGSAYGIGSNGYWYDRNYLNSNVIDVTFWFEGGCATGNLDVVPSFGVTALYSETSSILAYRGATMPQGGLGCSSNGCGKLVIGTALSNGKTIGEAILEHRSVPLAENYASQREYFTAQHILLGDGTLRLQEYQH